MRKMMIAVGSALVGSLLSAAVPEVGNVVMSQPPNTRTVTIAYMLANAPAVVTLDIETNVTGNVWASIGADNFQHVSGDVNKMVSGKETYAITWQARRDWRDRVVPDGGIRAVLTAWAPDHTPDYMVVDLTAAAGDNVRYYVSTNYLPGGLLANPAYRTTSIVMRRIDAKNVTWTMGSTALELGREPNVNCGMETPHEVTLTNDYYIGVFEVTQKQWEMVAGSNPAKWTGSVMRPVERVSYNEIRVSATKTATDADYANYDWPNDPCADSFLGKLRAKTQVDFDLPSEAQWEFACRAGLQTGCEVWRTGCWNDGSKILKATAVDQNLNRLGRYSGNKADGVGGFTDGTAPVGSYAPNAWGLYDMHGNLIEWCLDWFAFDITALNGAVNTVRAGNHARRDGAWNNSANYQRMAVRASNVPDGQFDAVGLRLACRAGQR
ncbi:MAG: formylglycine-generating enzyme family protein [Kiritimatiellae bacterium]|nr:formylglycine-generating enzyme family protein [Kiritimatiellia bacterium]